MFKWFLMPCGLLLVAAIQKIMDKGSKAAAIIAIFSCIAYAAGIFIEKRPLVDYTTSIFASSPSAIFAVKLDEMGFAYETIIAASFFLCQIYAAIKYNYEKINCQKEYRKFCILSPLAASASLFLARSGSMYSILFGYEWLTIITGAMVGLQDTEKAKSSAKFYTLYLMATSVALIILCCLFSNLGISVFRDNQPSLGQEMALYSQTIAILTLMGASKAAIFPFHSWLMHAMEAPAMVSALLHSSLVVGAGIFTIARIFLYIFPIQNKTAINAAQVLYIVGAISSIYSALMMLNPKQTPKKYIALNTMNGLSWIVCSIGAKGLKGGSHCIYAISHDFRHLAIIKLLAFLICDNYIERINSNKKSRAAQTCMILALVLIASPFVDDVRDKIERSNTLHEYGFFIGAFAGFTSLICSFFGSLTSATRIILDQKNKNAGIVAGPSDIFTMISSILMIIFSFL